MEDKSFLGTGWHFPPVFSKKEPITAMSSAEDDIQQSLEILLNTHPGERVHRYSFGCPIRQFIYEKMTTSTQTAMRETIRRAILLHEPRIKLNAIRFDLEKVPDGILGISLDYTVLMTNRRSNMVFPFYLQEGTDIEINLKTEK